MSMLTARSVISLALLAGRASTSGAQPHDMSVVHHEAEASSHEAEAGRHAAQYDDRDRSPFEHREDIAGVAPLTEPTTSPSRRSYGGRGP
jgi:hypothetical protein